MKPKRQALDVLLARRGTRRLGLGPMIALSLGLYVVTFPLVTPRVGAPPVCPDPLLATFVLAVWCAWDSRLLERAHRNRFLESALLTSMTPAEWSDRLLGHALVKVLVAATPVFLLNLYCSVPPNGTRTAPLLWWPAVLALTACTSYIHQLYFASSRRALLVAPLVLCGGLLVWALACANSSGVVAGLYLCAMVLGFARTVIFTHLEALAGDPAIPSSNTGRGARVGTALRLVAIIGFMFALGLMNTTAPPASAPSVGTLLWDSSPALETPRQGFDAELLLISLGCLSVLGLLSTFAESLLGCLRDRHRLYAALPMTSANYTSRWLREISFRRWAEMGVALLAALMFWAAGPPLTALLACLALSYVFATRGVVCIGLLAGVCRGNWVTRPVYLLQWLCGAVLGYMCLAVLAWLPLTWLHVCSPYEDPPVMFLAGIGVLTAFAFQRRARRVVERTLGTDDGALLLPELR